jgi:type I restriction-modification system DNA methylase subunit
MPVTCAEARIEIARLVDQFAGLSARNRKRYNEAATRQEFILPLFHALGWKTRNAREVSPEEKVSRGFVDFAFRIGGIPRFFLETKKIPADLEDPRWARQAINYAWLKGVTWAVLTDFEGLKVFNAEWQETIPARAIFKDLTWEQYLDRFDDLWLLSRPAMEEGALDQAAEAVGKKAKRTPVNRLLLADLTQWRRDLFQTLRAYNPTWTIAQIDQAVQRILDRLIFIRAVEDREIEPPRLHPLVREWRDRGRKRDLVAALNALFREFDTAYDTRLFAPHLCEELESEPTPFEAVIDGLYDVPGGYGFYDFNAIDADVLGAIYEQYLGYVAQDPQGKAVVSKREKRKARGIYYTPRFVVRYIVEQTLGRFLGEADYERARQVRVLDMACGSGSFLIEAFDVLDRYLAGMRGQPAASAAGDAHDLARRMEILTGNLYGVDLDAQAVEIARLNLLLKAVNQRALLPELANVRQGNSLVSGTPEELGAAFGPDWRDKRPFNWEEEWPQVMERDGPTTGSGQGFDVIMGNPPYVNVYNLPRGDSDYYRHHYESFRNKCDLYGFFLERAIGLLRTGGLLGFITSRTWLSISSFSKLRKLILDKTEVLQLATVPSDTFPDATVETIILILRKVQHPNPESVTSVYHFDGDIGGFVKANEVPRFAFADHPQQIFNLGWQQEVGLVFKKLKTKAVKLGDITSFSLGIKPGRTAKFVRPRKKTRDDRPIVRGRDIYPYLIVLGQEWIWYVPEEIKKIHGARPRDPAAFDRQEKIVLREISRGEIIAAYDQDRLFPLDTVNVVFTDESPYSLKYLLGLLNSTLINWWYGHQFIGLHVKLNQLTLIPIRRINFDDPAEAARHERVVALVEEMLRLQKEHAQAEALKEDRRHDLARRIAQLDAEIDALVYELRPKGVPEGKAGAGYGLTEEEIAVVEGA